MNAKLCGIVFLLSAYAFQLMPSGPASGPVTGLADIPDHGWGRVSRVNNKTKFAMDVGFDKTIHDLLPEGTIAVLRSLDPKLGPGGKLVRIVQEPGTTKLKPDGTSPKERNAQFEVKRRLAADLTDWIGFSSPSFDNQVIRVNPDDSHHVACDTKDFAQDGHKSSHWKLQGKDLSECRLESRLSGFLQNLVLEEDYALGKDEEKVDYAQDLWCCSSSLSWQVTGGRYGIDNPPSKPTFDVVSAEYWGTRTWETRGSWNWGRARYNYDSHSERKSVDIRNWVRDRINADGAYTINNIHTQVGDPCPGFVKKAEVKVRVFGEILIESSTTDGTVQRIDVFGHPAVVAKLKFLNANKTQEVIDAATKDLRERGRIDWAAWSLNGRFGDPVPGMPKVVRVNLVVNGAPTTLTGNEAQGISYNLGGSTFTFSGDKWTGVSGSLRVVAVGNKDAVWGVSSDRTLVKFDGTNWQAVPTNMPVSFVAVTSKNEVFVINADNSTVWRRTAEGFKQISGNLKRISARTPEELWGVGTDDKIYRYDGSEWVRNSNFNGGTARDVSVAADGSVWATSMDNKLFRSDDSGKNWTLIPMDAFYVAARGKQEAYVVKGNQELWKFYNGNWTRLPGAASHISCASGFNVTKIPAKRAKRTVETFTVRNQEGKPAEPNDGSKFAIEIVKLGMGGGIPAQSSSDFIKIPAFKNPRVSGFAQYQLPDINQGSLIKVNPLRSQGAAWLETTLPVPGKATITFNARPGSAGDVQVLFGQEVSNSFVWKVVIGGWRNTKAAIMKRFYEAGKPKDVFVCEIGRDQNPLAAAIPGNFTPYWVSINEGLILVGVGNVGENPFMAWRDPNPPDDVNICGFGSYKSPVEYTEVQVLPAVDVQGTLRKYKQESQKFDVAAGKDAIRWLKQLPFRVVDRGTIAATVQADGSAALVLSAADSLDVAHYAVVFGDDDNKKLSLKKWLPGKKAYIERASLRYDTYPELVCKADKKIRFWVCFNSGTISLGTGVTGQNTLLVVQDLNSHNGISRIGVGSFGKTPATFTGVEIGAPVDFGIEKQLETYRRAKATFKYAGNMTIVTPFEYLFSQEEQSVKLTDLVNDSTYYPGGTPQQGAFYDFMLSIEDDGTPKLTWVNEPSNPKKLELERRVQKLNADADLARATKEIMDKDAAISKSVKLAEAQRIRASSDIDQQTAEARAAAEKDKAQAKGDIKKAEYNAALTTGDKIADAGVKIAGVTSASSNPIIAGIGIGVGSALIAGGLVKSALAEGMLREAAEEDARGVNAAAGIRVKAADDAADGKKQAAVTEEQAAVIEAQMNKKALEREYQAAELENQAKLLNGEVSGFRRIDAYVYTDQAPRTPLGTSSIPPEAIENRATLETRVINATMNKRPSTKELFEEILSLYKFGINLITHFHVIDKKATKQQMFDTINALVSAYPRLYGSSEIDEGVHNDLINLLMAARNNPYFIDLNVADERKAREVWYASANQLARALISKGRSGTIVLNSTFGEYVWLTEGTQSDDVVEVSFEAMGLNDIFIGFSDETVPMRNTSKEFYEVVLGAWDNTRHVVRLKSLDRSVHEVSKEQDPKSMLTTMEFDTYSVRFDHGKITVTKGKGKKVVFVWQDPYPIKGLRRLGVATWNSPITFKNIQLNGKEVGKQDVDLEALSKNKPTEAIQQALDLFAELENTVGKEALEKTEDEETVTLMDTLEEVMINAADNGFKKRRSMTPDALKEFVSALDAAQNWFAVEAHFKKAEFYLTTMAKELLGKGIEIQLEEGGSSARQTGERLAEVIKQKAVVVEEKPAVEAAEGADASESDAVEAKAEVVAVAKDEPAAEKTIEADDQVKSTAGAIVEPDAAEAAAAA